MEKRPLSPRRFVSTFTALATVLSVFSPMATLPAYAAGLFSDGFEPSSGFSNWTSVDTPRWEATGTGSHSGTKKARVTDDTGSNDDILVKNVSTSGYQSIILSYWYRIDDPLGDDDHVYVQWSTNGSTWITVANYTNTSSPSSWTKATHTLLASANNSVGFRFRFRAHLEDGGFGDRDEFLLDDVSLTGDVLATPTPPTPTPPPPTPTPETPTPTPTPETPTPTPTPTAVIHVIKMADGTVTADDVFDFSLMRGGDPDLLTQITGPELASISLEIPFASEATATVSLQETGMPLMWRFVSAFCVDAEETPIGVSLTEGNGIRFPLNPGDDVTCIFLNRRLGGGGSNPTGTLTVEKYIRGSSVSFDYFTFEVNGSMMGFSGHFDESGRNTFNNAPATEYLIAEDQVEGYTTAYGGECDEEGVIQVPENGNATCTITNTADGWQEGDGERGPEPTPTPTPNPDEGGGGGSSSSPATGTLVVQKVILFGEDASVSYSDFGFMVGSQSQQFEEDGTNELTFEAGQYSVLEDLAPGYTTAYGGDCDAQGNVTIVVGQTATCVITNTLGVGGFNPGSEVPAPTPTPSPTPTAGTPPTGGSGGGSSADGSAGVTTQDTPGDSAEETPAVTASPSEDEAALEAAIGDQGHWPPWLNWLLPFLLVLWWMWRRRNGSK